MMLPLLLLPCVTQPWPEVDLYYVVPDSFCVQLAKRPGPITKPKYWWYSGTGCLVTSYDTTQRAYARRRHNPHSNCRKHVPGTEPR